MALELGSSRSNVLAVVEETTEGTLVDPSSGADYVALQTDASLTPSFESLTNEELRSSIGEAKPIQGIERPTASFSHYLKHSGIEGQTGELHEILKALFGATSTNGTERSLTTGSTVSVLEAAAGGSDFARGKAVMIKDSTNGYRIRPIHSVSTNALTLGFQVPTGAAPLTGVALGKCINYAPVNNGHKSLSIHMYRGNGQAIEAMAGAKVTQMTLAAQAGQFLNTTYQFLGSKYFFDPIRIGATNKYLDFDIGGSELSAVIAEGVYRDPYELASALETAMDALSADEITVTYNSKGANKGKFTISTGGSELNLLWQTGTNTANSIGATLGFDVVADDSSALTYSADDQQDWSAPHTPSYDSSDPLVVKNMEVLLGESDDFECFESSSVNITFTNSPEEINSICAESGINSNPITGRVVEVQIEAYLDKHEAETFKRFRSNDTLRFAFNFGSKSGGNWVPGKCGNVYIPDATLTNFELTNQGTVIALSLTLKAFVDSNGNGEVYLNFL